MSDRPENGREFLQEFIELYKSLPCLWNVKSAQYRDTAVKSRAYGLLAQKYREILPNATKRTVKCKINTLRTTYKKVLGKVNRSIQSGATGDEVYRPTLWYFHLFDFLRELEPQNDPERRCRRYGSEIKRNVEYDEDEGSDDKYYSSDHFVHAPSSPSLQLPEHNYNSTTTPRERISRKRKRALRRLDEERSEQIAAHQWEEDDPFDLYGRHIANKLRSLTVRQNMFAQKLINDILFEAEMTSLSRGCKIVSETASAVY